MSSIIKQSAASSGKVDKNFEYGDLQLLSFEPKRVSDQMLHGQKYANQSQGSSKESNKSLSAANALKRGTPRFKKWS